MTQEQIVRAIGRMNAKADLEPIRKALNRRWRILDAREQAANDQVVWEQAQSWGLDATLYCHKEIVAMEDQRFTFRRGERFIVRQFMPRARAVCFRLPDRPDWKGKLYQADCTDLRYLDFHPEPPSAPPAPQRTQPHRGAHP